MTAFHALAAKAVTIEALTKPSAEFGVALVTITPDMAKELLKTQATNRTAAPATFNAYALDMLGGRWNGRNGTSISLNTEGRLMDGQHRLNGIIASDTPVDLVVFTGVSDEARRTMDDGRKRSAADELNMGQTGDGRLGTKLVSALRALAILTTGQGAGGRMTKGALLALLEKHPKIVDSVRAVSGDKDVSSPVRPSVVTAMHYIAKNLMKGQKARADAMVATMLSGVPAYEGDPMLALRELANRKIKDRVNFAELEVIRAMAAAWKLYKDGSAVEGRKFKVPATYRPADDLPELDVSAVFGDMPDADPTSALKARQPAVEAAPEPEATPAPAKAKKAASAKPTGKGKVSGKDKATAAVMKANGGRITGEQHEAIKAANEKAAAPAQM